ncbi:histidine phosphatase family protein [Dapis sp. BLCC M229]|uniref:histidine phosphatase family protein n=1 Tax=Dapis sp. BLCC M229 TaxID=3400188 RepID=UPI003CF3B71B
MPKLLQNQFLCLISATTLATTMVLTGCSSPSSDTANDTTNPGEATAQTMTEGEIANANFKDKLSGTALLNALKQGGYVIYICHAQTEKDYADQVTAVMGNCATQRTLSEVGWKQAKSIGEGFRKNAIPFDKVISSQYCRAWQTADLAFGKYEKNGDLNFPKAEDYSDQQIVDMKARLDPMLTAVPLQGTNTVIVGHDDLFEASTGIYPDPQGMAYVIKPDGSGNFDLVANVLPDEWLKLGGT